MKKSGILNSTLSKVIASLGHTNQLVICDCGLPIPHNAEVIDLALVKNIPGMVQTLNAILEEFEVEGAIIAKEMKEKSAELYTDITLRLKAINVNPEEVSHEKFKEKTREHDTVFVRTGEATPYANIILISGVTF